MTSDALLYRLTNHLRLSNRLPNSTLIRRPSKPLRISRTETSNSRTYATSRITDKTRILEKPTRFNPPSHGSRRVRPRQYPGAPLSEAEREAQRTKQYPHMMPPEGSFMYSFLTDRRLHLFITLGTLSFLATYSLSQSFLHTTIYRDQLPNWSDLLSHPFQTIGQFYTVYKLHVSYESEKVAEKRRQKLADAQKRKEFLREHGVEPGFLTGSWMDKFGTVEGDEVKKANRKDGHGEEEGEVDGDTQSPVNAAIDASAAAVAGSVGAGADALRSQLQSSSQSRHLEDGDAEQPQTQNPKPEKKKVKMWLGIW